MGIGLVGLNHKTTPVKIREEFSFTKKEKRRIIKILKENQKIKEAIILSTCNRTEIYYVSNQELDDAQVIKNILSEFSFFSYPNLAQYLYNYNALKAIKHLYRVASGLDSMILGECQILNQIKKAYQLAESEKVVDTILHNLFTEAFRVGKKVRNQTKISENQVSVSYAAVEMADKLFGNLEDKKILILGAGKMSRLTLKGLYSEGVNEVVVANRTLDKAADLAEQFSGQAIRWSEVDNWLKKADIVVSSTAAPHYIIDEKQVKEAIKSRNDRPLFFIDIAVPRDIKPSITKFNNVYVYNIDDLESVLKSNSKERKKAVEAVNEIIREEVIVFKEWLNSRKAVPTIKSLRKQAEDIRQKELETAFNKLDKIDAKQRDVIENLTTRIINKLLHQPTVKLKEFANIEDCDFYLQAVNELFALEERKEKD